MFMVESEEGQRGEQNRVPNHEIAKWVQENQTFLCLSVPYESASIVTSLYTDISSQSKLFWCNTCSQKETEYRRTASRRCSRLSL
jgi:hypothetical protein